MADAVAIGCVFVGGVAALLAIGVAFGLVLHRSQKDLTQYGDLDADVVELAKRDKRKR